MNNCPFLGLDDDPQTSLGFASDRNYCYRTEKPTPILLNHQQKYCLSKKYSGCPVFQDISHLTLPLDVQQDVHVKPVLAKRQMIWVVLVLACLIGVIGMAYNSKAIGIAQKTNPTSIAIASPLSVSATPVLSLQLPATTAPTLTTTQLPSPTSSQISTSVPVTNVPLGLETPIAVVPQLVIHKIKSGDSLAILASRFGTNIQTIRRANYYLPVPMWEGTLVVIPVNTTDASTLPTFEPYQVKERTQTLKDIAFTLNTDPELVSKYNNLNPNTILFQGSWLVIPRPLPPPTGLPLETPDGKIQNYGE